MPIKLALKKRLKNVFYSFPVQLSILHFRNHLMLIACWILTLLLAIGISGRLFGVKYLFLTPEYLGQVGFLSFFFVGFAFGGFFMAWNLAAYTLSTHHFPFLASLERPFTKFCINNAVVPLIFMVIYLGKMIHFQWYDEYWSGSTIATNILGIFTGFLVTILMFALYFEFTNKDILYFIKKRRSPPNLARNIIKGRRGAVIELVKSDTHIWRVDTYLTERLRPRIVRSVAHYDSKFLLAIFRQNHGNALVVQMFSIMALITMGYMIDSPYFRIPAAASFFILMAMVVSFVGALVYWLQQWRVMFFILFIIAVNFITKYDFLKHTNKGYGLNYKTEKAIYSKGELSKIANPQNVSSDIEKTIQILEKWKKRIAPTTAKPKMILFNTSGGGIRGAVWAMQVLKESDKVLNGKVLDQTVLITGASGGILGAAYMRELYLRNQFGEQHDLYGDKYIGNIGKDILNPIFFTIVSNDLFMPWSTFEQGGHKYRKDRGYVFEKTFHENTDSLMLRTVGEYQQYEESGKVPLLFITPTILNDTKRLIISPLDVSYMMQPPVDLKNQEYMVHDMVDFGRFFETQGADNMQMSSALRMNATYPYILPNVYLPSEPVVEVVDAGVRDNYGIATSARFVQVFKDWILENTSGVIVMKVVGWGRDHHMSSSEFKGVFDAILNPLDMLGQLSMTQAYEHDAYLSFLEGLLGKDKFDVVEFIYRPSASNERASMNFHLSNRERFDVLNAFFLPQNQKSLLKLRELMKD